MWILKPPNMARSLDMTITDNLPLMIRTMETGPKIAQKYISNPVLRRGKKVDLRYILLVKSIEPLVLYLYKNFWIRSANNDYTVDRRHLSTYETQFTVMNYGEVTDFKQKTAYEILSGLVGSEMCIRDRRKGKTVDGGTYVLVAVGGGGSGGRGSFPTPGHHLDGLTGGGAGEWGTG